MPELKVTFPKSSEDSRLQLAEINGSIFAILHSSLESDGPINLYCEEWNLILLAAVKSKKKVAISAINLICLNEITSESGEIFIHTSKRFVNLVEPQSPPRKDFEVFAQDEDTLYDQMGALLYHHQAFKDIISKARSKKSSAIAEAQKTFIASLCALADKVTGGVKELTIPKVLKFWGIINKRSSSKKKRNK
ncbi:MAG: hypothetical protein P0S96_05530 [Simkaniaceae bacterium]|nr:hypothetical protein [Candidatus Sacchlamyda saccharinae]